MKKLLWTVFVLIILLIFIGLASCIETGDEERPGLQVSTSLLFTKVWQVQLFKDDGLNKSILFSDVYLEFKPNFIFKITKGCEVIEGEWVLSSDSTLLVIRIPDSPEPLSQLEDEWVVTWLTDTEMRFIEQDNKGDEEFHLSVAPLPALNCQSCENLVEILADSVWSITGFTNNARDMTEEVRGAYLDFNSNGEMVLKTDYEELAGLWALTDHCQILEVQWLNDQSGSELYTQLANSWFIVQIDNKYMSLENQNSGTMHMTKGKLPDCEPMHSSLLQTSWSIENFTINEDNVSENFLGTGLTFLENNQLATEVVVGPAVLGDWTLDGNCDQLNINIQAGQLKELSREWIITDFQDYSMTLVFEEGTLRMELRLGKGKPVVSDKCFETIDFLTSDNWIVHKFTDSEEPGTDLLSGYKFRYGSDGALVVSNSDSEHTGSWYPTHDCQYVVIEIDRNSEVGSILGTWKITDLNDHSITLVYEKRGKQKTIELVMN